MAHTAEQEEEHAEFQFYAECLQLESLFSFSFIRKVDRRRLSNWVVPATSSGFNLIHEKWIVARASPAVKQSQPASPSPTQSFPVPCQLVCMFNECRLSIYSRTGRFHKKRDRTRGKYVRKKLEKWNNCDDCKIWWCLMQSSTSTPRIIQPTLALPRSRFPCGDSSLHALIIAYQ